MYSSNKVVATCKGYVDIPQGYESILLSACYENGPISVAIDASHEDFQVIPSVRNSLLHFNYNSITVEVCTVTHCAPRQSLTTVSW